MISRFSRGIGRRRLIIVVVFLSTIPAMLSLFRSPGYWESHDGLFHLYRLLALEDAWRQGHLYPRIFPEFAFGYGFPVLHFYGPLTYYLALAGRLLGLSSVAAIKLTYTLSYPLAALAIWRLAREVWGDESRPNEVAGMVAAVVYTYVPYHLADVQLRGALAESWAFVWWPWLLWTAWRRVPVAFMLALAGLVLTHNLSVILIALPLGAWLLIAWRRAPDRRYVREIAAALAGAAAITAFYWLPVLLESRYVTISQDIGGLGFARHLQHWREWVAASALYRYFPDQQVAAEHPLSWAQIALLAVALPLGLWGARAHRPVWLFGWLTLLLSLFLLTPASYGLWERLVFPFGLIQYPWRWLGIASLAMALVVGGAFTDLPHRLQRVALPLGLLLLLWLAGSGLAELPYRERAVEVARFPVNMWQEDAANGQVGATWTAEFLPLTVTEQRWALARAPEHVSGVGGTSPLRLTRLNGDAWRFDATVEAASDSDISISRFAYPSMRARVDGEMSSLAAKGLMGVAAVPVPAGAHTVSIDAQPLADNPWLSAFFFLLILIVVAVTLWARPRVGAALVVLLLLFLFNGLLRRPEQIRPIAGVDVGSQAQLVGWRAGTVRAGQPSAVTLYWFNLRQTDQNYVTFLHLTTTQGGAPIAQHDSQPNMGTIPTTRWLPGQLVEDLHLLEVPDGLDSGSYLLWAGLYDMRDGQAVPVAGDSGERRFLGEIEVE